MANQKTRYNGHGESENLNNSIYLQKNKRQLLREF